MGLYIDEKNGDKFLDGTKGCCGVLRFGSNQIEIWDEDYERHYGNVPSSFTTEHINVVMQFYRAGELRGEEHGKIAKQFEIKKVLGLN